MPPLSPVARLIPRLQRSALADPTGPSDGQLLGAFVRTKDADAFAGLVRRHGPMVLGVCRRVVGDRHAADDAFQAAFLVLALRAAVIRPREQVGNWLYGVAYRTALKARVGRARLRVRETQVDPMPQPAAPSTPEIWPDLMPIIDAELALLPDKLRLPVVLCDLEGRTQRDVAKHLGVPPATLATRLATARRTLAKRLTDRGITLSGGALATLLTAHAATAAVPHTLLATTQALTTGTVPATVAHLSDGVLRMMLLAKLKATTVAVLAVVALVGGFGAGTWPAFADDSPTPPASPTPAPAKPVLGPGLSDAEFLRKVCLDLRGRLPSQIEAHYFLADKDNAKRKKVVGWLADDVTTVSQLPDVEMYGSIATLSRRQLQNDSTQLAWAFRNHATQVRQVTFSPDGKFVDVPAALDAVRVWDLSQRTTTRPAGNQTAETVTPIVDLAEIAFFIASNPTGEFLQRILNEAHGRAPTRVETEYFTADTDPAKQTKIIEWMLQDPAIIQKVGSGWKERMLRNDTDIARIHYFFEYSIPTPDRLEALIGELFAAKKTDAHVLDGIATALLGRLPTESEAKLALAAVAKAVDKRAAWRDVVASLATTADAKRHAADLTARSATPEPAPAPKSK